MASINEKLNYINETKSLIKNKLNDLGSEIKDETTFRDYAEKIEDLYNEWPKVNGSGSTISLSPTRKGRITSQINGNTFQQTYSGKNLLKINNGSRTSNGITGSYNDGILSYGGTATATSTTLTNNTNNVLTAGNYTFSIDKAINARTRLRLTLNDDTTQDVTISENTTSVQFNLTQSTKSNYIFLFNLTAGTSYSGEIKCMIEPGSTATSFEPFVGRIASPNPDYPQDIEVVTGENTITISNEDNTKSQTFNINLGNLELCKMENDKEDYLFKENNNWYKYGIVKKRMFNGTETWTKGAAGGVTRYQYSLSDGETITGRHSIFSNYFNYSASTNKEGIGFISNSVLYLYPINIESLEDWKFWLSNHNVLLYYITITPTITQITDITLISQLNALEKAMSYNTQTNISQDNDNLPFIINATALMKNSD